jgi:hypothetical protein
MKRMTESGGRNLRERRALRADRFRGTTRLCVKLAEPDDGEMPDFVIDGALLRDQ